MIHNWLITKALIFFAAFAFILMCGCGSVKKVAPPMMDARFNPSKAPVTDSFLSHLLDQHPQFFDSLLKNKDRWRVQIIYTQIDRKKDQEPRLKHYYYNVYPAQYFYPASTVKLPTALLALQKLNDLMVTGLDKHTMMITETGYNGLRGVYNDPTSPDGRPTIAHYIKKILLVSDNDAFNRLYEFLGQEYLNKKLQLMGYNDVQIVHRLEVPLTEDQNRYTNPIRFFDTATKVIYQQPLVKSNWVYQARNNKMGKGYYLWGRLVEEPFDFSAKNRLSLPQLHSVLQSVIFPRTMPKAMRFHLTNDDYRFLYKYMSMSPRESDYPSYDSTYNDAYVKFLFYGAKDPVDSNIYILNKVGDAYGFLTDAAYIIDTKSKIEFMLSATLLCNSDGIFNDDKYDYETVGLPFMKNLGRVIYQYELSRKRRHAPTFDKFLTK
jgi:hypothetical protein